MKNLKLSTKVIGIVLLLIIIVAVVLFSQYRTKSIKSFFDNNPSKITKVDISNGNNGEVTTVTDKEVIKHISDYLSNVQLKKFSPPASSGWSYNLQIYENDKQVLFINCMGDTKWSINGSKYKIIKSTNVTLENLYNEAKKNSKFLLLSFTGFALRASLICSSST